MNLGFLALYKGWLVLYTGVETTTERLELGIVGVLVWLMLGSGMVYA